MHLLPVISEDTAPNSFYLKQFEAGETCKWNSPDDMIAKIESSLKVEYNKQRIKEAARKVFDPTAIARALLC